MPHSEQQLHDGDVEPAVELAAHLPLDADQLEAAAFVQGAATPSPLASMRAITAWNPDARATSTRLVSSAVPMPSPPRERSTYTESSTVVR